VDCLIAEIIVDGLCKGTISVGSTVPSATSTVHNPIRIEGNNPCGYLSLVISKDLESKTSFVIRENLAMVLFVDLAQFG
jgi:hypothetical protein